MVTVGLIREPGKFINVIRFFNIIDNPIMELVLDIEKLDDISAIQHVSDTEIYCEFAVTYGDKSTVIKVSYDSEESLKENILTLENFFVQKTTKELYDNRQEFNYSIEKESTNYLDRIPLEKLFESAGIIHMEDFLANYRFGKDIVTSRSLSENLPTWSNC